MCICLRNIQLLVNKNNKLDIRIFIRNQAHLPTILSFYSSFGFTHVERGVIHPKVKRKLSD